MKRLVPHDAILIPKDAKRVFSGILFDVYQWQQKLFDGTFTTYEMLRRPDTVITLAIKDDKLVMIEEQQAGRPPYLRFPGGRVEAGEDWLKGAQREMLEETGLRFKQWRLIEVEQAETKIEWFIAIFLAYDASGHGSAHHDAGEKITVSFKDLHAVKRTIGTDGSLILKYSKRFFDKIDTMEQLKSLPAFRGKEI